MRNCRLFPILIAGFALVASACDRVTGVDHGHPIGVIIVSTSGEEVARTLAPYSVHGALHLASGAVGEFVVQVYDESGDVEEIDGEEYSIEDLKISDAEIAEVVLQSPATIMVTGSNPGSASIRFDLHHAGHLEFSVTDLPVIISD